MKITPDNGALPPVGQQKVILPSKTYGIDRENKRISGYVDGLEAIKQAVLLCLSTERFEYPIYSWNYGVELKEIIGKDLEFAKIELQRTITEALLQDDRITGVENFQFEKQENTLKIIFEVITILGRTEVEMNV